MLSKESFKVVVTGADGFIGSHLVVRLKSLGINVYPITKMPSKFPYVFGDFEKNILNNVNNLKKLLIEIQPHTILHLAHSNPKNQNYSDKKSLDLDYTLETNLIQAVLEARIQPHLIFLGSCSEYGYSSYPFSESLRPNPQTDYAKMKWEQSKKVMELNNPKDPPWTIIRPSVVYGPRQKQNLLIPQVIRALISKKPIELTEGSQTRDFIFVEDLVLALEAVIINANSVFSEVINIGFGKSFRIKDVAINIANLMGMNYSDYLIFGAIPKQQNDIDRYEVSIDKARKLLKWAPIHDLAAGLRKTLSAELMQKLS
jgi:UDP-glucose 4-epimerase